MHISLNYLSPFFWVYDSNPAGIDFNAFDNYNVPNELGFRIRQSRICIFGSWIFYLIGSEHLTWSSHSTSDFPRIIFHDVQKLWEWRVSNCHPQIVSSHLLTILKWVGDQKMRRSDHIRSPQIVACPTQLVI